MSSKKWSDEELERLKVLYPVYGVSKTADILGRTAKAVQVKASRNGIQTNHHTYNREYFDVIDSSDKAYWLGFITADGYVMSNEKNGNFELGIELCDRDTHHLEKFIKAIESDIQVTHRQRQNFLNRGYDTISRTAQIRVYSKHIVKSLEKYGIVQNKTQTLSEIPILGEYFWDYIRGYFDGDGTFAIRNIYSNNGNHRQYGTIGFVCHKEQFIRSLKSEFDSFGLSSYITLDRNNWMLSIRETYSVIYFLNLIYYSDNITKLDRKYEKVINFYNGMPALAATPA